MKLAKLLSLLLALMLMLSLCACDEIGDNNPVGTTDQTDTPPVREDYPISFEDQTFTAAPESVISLSPAITDVLVDLGVTEKLVGISRYCSLPGLDLPTVGSPAYPDFEKMISLAPELIITLSPIAATDRIVLEQAGIRVLEMSSPKSYGELCEIYINLSMVFFGAVDSKDIAYDALEHLDSALLKAKNMEFNKTFICVEGTYDGGLVVSGADTLEGDLFSVFGTNLLADYDSHFLPKELYGELSPEVVFLYDTVDDDDIEEIFEDADIVYVDASALERPSAGLYLIIESSIEDVSR